MEWNEKKAATTTTILSMTLTKIFSTHTHTLHEWHRTKRQKQKDEERNREERRKRARECVMCILQRKTDCIYENISPSRDYLLSLLFHRRSHQSFNSQNNTLSVKCVQAVWHTDIFFFCVCFVLKKKIYSSFFELLFLIFDSSVCVCVFIHFVFSFAFHSLETITANDI